MADPGETVLWKVPALVYYRFAYNRPVTLIQEPRRSPP